MAFSASLPAALRRRAREDPEAPWLFFRHGLDWHWRSYRRVADQVARSAERLAAPSARRGAVACRPGQHPDVVAALLAALAVGAQLDLDQPIDLDAERRDGWLAECRGPLERFEPRELEIAARPPSTAPDGSGAVPTAATKLLGGDQRSRPILYAGAAAAAGVRLLTLAEWCLELDAAWALEEQADAFAATALWTRPHGLVATASELAALAERWDRSARRHSRLRVVVRVGPGDEASDRSAEDHVEAPVVPWR